MTILRNIFELLKEFVSLPRRLIFGIIGIWAFIWLSKEFGLYLMSEGREISANSVSRFRKIEFIADHFLLAAFFLRLLDVVLMKFRKSRKNSSEMDK